MAKIESEESVHFKRIIESLIEFLKFHQMFGLETDFMPEDVIGLLTIFRRVTEIKTELLKHLMSVLSDLHALKPIETDSLAQMVNQVTCLQEFSSCINAEVIAKRLSSPEVRVLIFI